MLVCRILVPVPVCVLAVCRPGLVAKVFASVEVPHHGDLPQHHPALRHWEAAGCSEKVGAAPRPREVTVLHFDGSSGQHCHHGLAVLGLKTREDVDESSVSRGVRCSCEDEGGLGRGPWGSQESPCQGPPGCRSRRCRWSLPRRRPASCQLEPLLPWRLPAQTPPLAAWKGRFWSPRRGTSRRKQARPLVWWVNLGGKEANNTCC